MSFLKSFKAEDVDSSKLGVDKEMLDLLYDVAILGICRSYFIQATYILTGYLAAVPDSERARIGMGLLAIGGADYDFAVELLKDDLLELHPDSVFGKVYLGIAYKGLEKNDEAKKCFNDVIKGGKEPAAIELAKAALEQLGK